MTDRDRHRVQGLIAIIEDRSLTDEERCRYAIDAAQRLLLRGDHEPNRPRQTSSRKDRP